jgi:hypothetical protein
LPRHDRQPDHPGEVENEGQQCGNRQIHGEEEAMLLYDVHTNTPAGTLRTAEYFRLTGTKIASTILVFDATEWKAMLARQGKTVDSQGRVIDLSVSVGEVREPASGARR